MREHIDVAALLLHHNHIKSLNVVNNSRVAQQYHPEDSCKHVFLKLITGLLTGLKYSTLSQ